MESNEITTAIQSIREELGYKRGVPPVVEEAYLHANGHIDAVVPDRAEKSLCLGPRGRVAAEFAKRTGQSITYYGRDELAVREQRLSAASRRIDELQTQLEEDLKPFLRCIEASIRAFMDFPKTTLSESLTVKTENSMGIAFSGGIDSAASLVLCRNWSPLLVALTADLGPRILSKWEKQSILDWCDSMKVPHKFIMTEENTRAIHAKAESGNIHPCGACHERIMGDILVEAKSQGIDILVTGELLPTGRQSIEYVNGTLVVHLPAVFSLTKYETKTIAENAGFRKASGEFGCRFLRNLHSKGWSAAGPSLYRVLRELEAGVLTTGQALDLAKNIVKPAIKLGKIPQGEERTA